MYRQHMAMIARNSFGKEYQKGQQLLAKSTLIPLIGVG